MSVEAPKTNYTTTPGEKIDESSPHTKPTMIIIVGEIFNGSNIPLGKQLRDGSFILPRDPDGRKRRFRPIRN